MDITYEPSFNGYPINTDREKGMGCYTKGLAILQDKLESMMENHSKVLVTRVDLRYPQDGSVEPSSKDFTLFNKNLTRDLERNNILPETGRIRGKKRHESNNAPKHQVDPSVTIVCEKHGEDKNPLSISDSFGTCSDLPELRILPESVIAVFPNMNGSGTTCYQIRGENVVEVK